MKRRLMKVLADTATALGRMAHVRTVVTENHPLEDMRRNTFSSPDFSPAVCKLGSSEIDPSRQKAKEETGHQTLFSAYSGYSA